MSGPNVDLGDVTGWALAREIGDSEAVAQSIAELSREDAHAAIGQLLALVSIALAGTGGREPVDWLTAVIDDQRRRRDLNSPS